MYLCIASFIILGVGGLTQLEWDWVADGSALTLLTTASLVPVAGQYAPFSAAAELPLNQDVTLQWRESGASGTALVGNSNLSVSFLRRL